MHGTIAQELLERLLRDDHAAWAALVDEYAGLLTTLARRTFSAYGYPAAEQDAEDAVAEVWRNLLANDRRIIRQEIDNGHLLQTLVTLTRNRSIDIMRRRKFYTEPLVDQMPEPEAEIDADAFTQFPAALLAAAFRELAPKEQVCIKLFYLQRKKYREIAVLTAIPLNSIGPTIGRGLLKLRHILAESQKSGS